jgi:hypothetical protein
MNRAELERRLKWLDRVLEIVREELLTIRADLPGDITNLSKTAEREYQDDIEERYDALMQKREARG